MRIGCHTITWGGVIGDPVGVTSVKDLHYRASGSMEQAVADIGSLGYEGMEMFDGNLVDYGDRQDELRALLDKVAVELVSVYSGGNFIYDDILDDEIFRIRRAAALARDFGASTLVVGGGARRAAGTRDGDYAKLGAALDRVGDIADQHGLAACYHPHLSTIVENPEELDALMMRTHIGFCPDTAHLAAGGGDPAALIRRYPDRIHHVHLKDVRLDPMTFLPLGEGVLDFPGIVASLCDTGYDGWLIVELDNYDGDPREAAARSKSFLDKVLADLGVTQQLVAPRP